MKIRNGFVSNSSTSSFICDVTGICYVAGYDEEYEDGVVACNCENGHTFTDNYKLPADSDTTESWYKPLKPERCPICMFQEGCDRELFKYMLKKYNITRENLIQEIQDEFHEYSKFQQYINSKD